MMIESVSDPALKAMRSLASTDGSTFSGSGRIGSPNGGTLPGTRPVSSSSSGALAKRIRRDPSRSRTAVEFNRSDALSTNSRNPSPILITSALPPIDNGSPRTRAACSEVRTAS